MSRQELMKLLWESECDLTLTTDKKLKDPLGRVIGELKREEQTTSTGQSQSTPTNRVAVKVLSI